MGLIRALNDIETLKYIVQYMDVDKVTETHWQSWHKDLHIELRESL